MSGRAAVNRILLTLALMPTVAGAQQQTRTTCYDSGSTRICETFDGMGNVVAKSRCYQSGKDTRCDNTSFGGQTTPLPLDRRPTK